MLSNVITFAHFPLVASRLWMVCVIFELGSPCRLLEIPGEFFYRKFFERAVQHS